MKNLMIDGEDGHYVPKRMCTINRFNEIDDMDGCGEACELADSDCNKCPIAEAFDKLAKMEQSESYWEREAKRMAAELGEIKIKQEQNGWIKFTTEYDEERGVQVINCTLPEDGQEVLVTNGRDVWEDTFCNDCDDGCYFDNGYDIISEVIAWMPKPEPYKEEQE
ncbi:hypothetical protein lbkm_0665 [Lachnospiraceae bacterium KM106-2]|nr:hypothetical protein lbkm_0665 [Lachnospiraceae bacterium KM106-2]